MSDNTTSTETAAPSSTCTRCQGSVPTADVVEYTEYSCGGRESSVRFACPACATRDLRSCADCGTLVRRSSRRRTTGDGYVCLSCRCTRYNTCSQCGFQVIRADVVDCSGYNYCYDCSVNRSDYDFGNFSNASGSFTEIGSERCYGIELETSRCRGHSASLLNHPAWGAKDDCTVPGKEFYSAILSGDDGLDAVSDIAAIAVEKGWAVDTSCGYHLHLDMRDEKRNSLYAIAYAYRKTEAVWLSFVHSRRHTGSYCHRLHYTCDDIISRVARDKSFDSFSHRQDRYDWANLYAYVDHSTIEIRLFDGTLDEAAISNWVKVHTRFADWAANLGFEGVREALDGLSTDELFTLMAQEIWQDAALTIFYGELAQEYNHRFLLKSIGLANPATDIEPRPVAQVAF